MWCVVVMKLNKILDNVLGSYFTTDCTITSQPIFLYHLWFYHISLKEIPPKSKLLTHTHAAS